MILQPPAVLLCGPTGTGKTSALTTLIEAGIETFVLCTESGGIESLLDRMEATKLPMDKLHWNESRPSAVGWTGLEDMINKVSTLDQKGLADQSNMGKADHRAPALAFLNQMKDFQCQRTGQSYGDITKWQDDRAFVIDSLTGWSTIAWQATVGYKPTANPGEWGIAQNFIYNWLKKILSDRRCFFVLTSHQEKENDELTGIKKITVSTIGAKLGPKIPTEFSEVVQTKKQVDPKNGNAIFTWSTLEGNTDLKNRALPIGSALAPSFVPVVEAYRRRTKIATATPQLVAKPTVPPLTAATQGKPTAAIQSN